VVTVAWIEKKHFHVNARGRKKLAQMANTGITDQPVILGATLCGAQVRKLGKEENKRVQKAIATAKPCSFLPLEPLRKLQGATITSGAQYGWAVRRPNIPTFD
jgi:hypothetical protein